MGAGYEGNHLSVGKEVLSFILQRGLTPPLLVRIGMKCFTLHEVANNIYWAEFEDDYTLCMSFLRFQEYYESPDSTVRGQVVPYLDLIEKYSKGTSNWAFSYVADWGGFNLPSRVIEEVLARGIPDHNIYDYRILAIHSFIRSRTDKPYYLIGTGRRQESYLKHEIAHGLFYTLPEYEEEMLRLIEDLSPDVLDGLYQILLGDGYTSEVLDDEVQAYISTGMDDSFSFYIEDKVKARFEEVFNRYYEQFAYEDGDRSRIV